MSSSADVVRRFLDLLIDRRAAEAVALLDDEVVWRNTHLPTVHGRARVGRMLQDMERRSIHFDARLHHLAADGDVVLTERTDVLAYKRWQSEFWVCGTFEVEDGRIVLWHDHYSLGTFAAGAVKGLFGLLRTRR